MTNPECKTCHGAGVFYVNNKVCKNVPIDCPDCIKPESVVNNDVNFKIGKWLSAALEDSNVCVEMKEDIKLWFKSLNHECVYSHVIDCKNSECYGCLESRIYKNKLHDNLSKAQQCKAKLDAVLQEFNMSIEAYNVEEFDSLENNTFSTLCLNLIDKSGQSTLLAHSSDDQIIYNGKT